MIWPTTCPSSSWLPTCLNQHLPIISNLRIPVLPPFWAQKKPTQATYPQVNENYSVFTVKLDISTLPSFNNLLGIDLAPVTLLFVNLASMASNINVPFHLTQVLSTPRISLRVIAFLVTRLKVQPLVLYPPTKVLPLHRDITLVHLLLITQSDTCISLLIFPLDAKNLF